MMWSELNRIATADVVAELPFRNASSAARTSMLVSSPARRMYERARCP